MKQFCGKRDACTQLESQTVTRHASALLLPIAAVLAMLAPTAPSLVAQSPGSAWIDNGATACAKYLTPDVVAAILRLLPAHRGGSTRTRAMSARFTSP